MSRTSKEKGHARLTTTFASLINFANKFEISKWIFTNTDKQSARTVFISSNEIKAKNVIFEAVSIPAGGTITISDVNVVIEAGKDIAGFVDGVITGTAQAGTTATITLAAGSSAVDDYYNGMVIQITNDTPTGVSDYSNVIADYVGSTKVATLKYDWAIAPTSSTTYAIGGVYLTVEGVEIV